MKKYLYLLILIPLISLAVFFILRALFFSGPIRFPPNTTIVKTEGGAYAYENKTNEFQTQFKSSATAENSIVFENDLGDISFYTPSNQSFGQLSQGSSPTTDGSSLTYPEIFAGIDLKYTITSSRLLEEFIVKDAATATQITKIEQRATTKSTYVENDDGSFTFYNKSKEVFTLPHPVMYETGNKENKSEGIVYEIKADGDQLIITKVITDEGKAWLADPKRIYPVAIDLVIDNADALSETTVIDNADTSGNWTSSDATNTTVSQETTIKQEGTGSVKTQTTVGGAPVTADLMEYSSDGTAQAGYVTNGAFSATGGSITTSGGYTIHTFTGNGTFAPTGSGNVEVLAVGGGGGGGGSYNGSAGVGGGGGGGRVIYNAAYAVSGNIGVTIGGGGGPGQCGNDGDGCPYVNGGSGGGGGNSIFGSITAEGGGGGGHSAGASGGSAGTGGGGGTYYGGGGGGTSGYSGGQGSDCNSPCQGGGGGGGGGSASGPNGGNGYYSTISGSGVYYGGGGAGNGYAGNHGSPGAGGGAVGYVCGAYGSTGCTNGVGAAGNTGGGGSGGGGGGRGWGGAGGSGIVIVRYLTTPSLQSYTEGTIKTEGTYAIKGVAQTTGLNKTLTRTIASPLNLSDKPSVTFDIRASRTGSNIKVGLHDVGGTTTEVTPNITQADTFQSATIDLSGVTNANKDAIDKIIITIVNADATNTFYLDNMVAVVSSSLNDTVTRTVSATDLSAAANITYWVRSSVAGSYATFGFGEAAATEQTQAITINQANTWEQKTWDISGITGTARDAVTKFAFTFTGDTSGAAFYFDDIRSAIPATWVSSDATNTTISQETTIKQEGTGSIKTQTTAGGASVNLDLFEYAFDHAAQAPAITNTITATGGTITYSGGYTIHTFTSSGTFTVTSGSGNVETLVVAGGGGGGGWGGGGGGGGVIYNSSYAVTPGNITATIGAGGAAGTSAYSVGGNGNNSVFGSLTAIGGGGGGAWSNQAAGSGGSGGGGSGVGSRGTGTVGQGNSGGAAPGTTQSTPYFGHGGGGGAGAAGQGPMVGVTGGAGGIGLPYSISGTTTYYGGGGGGHSPGLDNPAVASGGLGGGGNGGNYYNSLPAYSGTANTGGGGGGNYGDASRPIGAGGSGIVVIRYPTAGYTASGYVSNATSFATGGAISTSGGYTIHTFTSSGNFTPTGSGNVEALVVAGGGGGGMDMGGGGGGGGVIYNASYAVSPPASVNTTASCKAILDAGASTGNGIYTIDPDGAGGNAAFQAYCNMTYDGGGWTMAVKSWYGSGMIGNTGAVGAIADATTRKGNAYKLSDVNIRNIIGASNNFDVMADQNGYNSAYSTGNYEYVVLRNYTGSWTYASGGMPASTSTTVFQSYRASDNALAWTGNIPCYAGAGLAGINCAGSTYQNPQGGAGCYINMGTASNAGWYHFYMNNSNDDTYLYICNGPQHSSSYDLNHRWWIRERGNVTVGIGGRGAPAASTVGQPGAHQYTIGASNGQDSKFYTLTAVGGGFGASSYYGYTPNYGTPGAGGSGGGPSAYSDTSARAGGAGTAGQGYAGGSGGGQYYSGGGGGAGGVGSSSPGIAHGGAGIQYSSISPLYWGGGGGGSSYSLGTASNGGIGGGGGGTRYAGSGGTGGAGLNNGQIGGTGVSNVPGAPGGNGGDNTGGGGGGGTHYNSNNKGGNGGSGIVIVRYLLPLQSYAEPTLKSQGSYSLKGVANITTSLNKTLTRTIASPLDLSDKANVTFDIRASRTGSNIKVGVHDVGGTTTEVTPNITQVDTFQSASIDLSGVTNANKDAIDSIIITIVNADAANTFYLDNMVATVPSSTNDTVTRSTAATDLSGVANITYWVRSSVAGSYATFGFGEAAATEQTQSITINEANTWEQKSWNIEGISAAGRNAVTKFAFTFTGDTSGAAFYFDDIQTNNLFAPTATTPTALSTTSIRWNFTDNSTEETGFRIYNTSDTPVATGSATNLAYIDETGLTLNTQYTRKVGTYNASSTSISSGTVSGYTLAAVPALPALSTRVATTININPDPGTNPAGTQMAIYRETGTTCDGAGGVYLAANGSDNGATAVWQTDAQWATVTATDLSGEQAYSFCIKARNGDNVETAFSTVGSYNAGFIPLAGNYICTQDTVSSNTLTNRYVDGTNAARYVIALDGGTGSTNNAVFEAKSCIMTLNSTDTLAVGSLELTGGSIAIATGGQIKIGQPVWAIDADADGYTSDTKLYYGAQPTNGVRKSAITTLATADCGESTYSTSNVCCTANGGACGSDGACCSAVCGTNADNDSYFSSAAGHTGTCKASALAYTDCNDGNASLYRSVAGYLDNDGDGYGVGAYTTCAGASGTYRASGADCYDGNASAYPGSGACSGGNRGDGSFDWNCDGGQSGCGAGYYGTTVIGYHYRGGCGTLMDGTEMCCYNPTSSTVSSGGGVGCGGGGYTLGAYQSWGDASCGVFAGWYYALGSYGVQACQ